MICCPNCGKLKKYTYNICCSNECSIAYRNELIEKDCVKCWKRTTSRRSNKNPICSSCEEYVTPLAYQSVRFRIFNRDSFRCVYCGKSSIEDNSELHIEHVLPRYTHENNSLSNIVTSCEMCNLSKSWLKLSPDIVERIHLRNIERNKSFSENEISSIEKILRYKFRKLNGQ